MSPKRTFERSGQVLRCLRPGCTGACVQSAVRHAATWCPANLACGMFFGHTVLECALTNAVCRKFQEQYKFSVLRYFVASQTVDGIAGHQFPLSTQDRQAVETAGHAHIGGPIM